MEFTKWGLFIFVAGFVIPAMLGFMLAFCILPFYVGDPRSRKRVVYEISALGIGLGSVFSAILLVTLGFVIFPIVLFIMGLCLIGLSGESSKKGWDNLDKVNRGRKKEIKGD